MAEPAPPGRDILVDPIEELLEVEAHHMTARSRKTACWRKRSSPVGMPSGLSVREQLFQRVVNEFHIHRIEAGAARDVIS